MGHFWAIGVGPGDPDLLTVKAVHLLRRAHVIYHAGPSERQGRAWEVIASLVRPEQAVRLLLHAPMGVISAADWRTHYRSGVEGIAADCRRGLDVAFVTEGDPTLYSTAACVWQLLGEIAPEIPVEVVPGVTSVMAAAASVHWPLAQKGDKLAVVPAGYRAAELPSLLDEFETVCLLKPSSVLPEVARTLAARAATHEAVYLENVGTPQAFVSRDLAALSERREYFSLLLVRRRPEPDLLTPAVGRVTVVGIGPGHADLLTAQARRALHDAEMIVGYEGYLESLRPLGFPAELRGSPIGAEAERAALALELAGRGRRVALVSSGDAGVYGMASLLLETAEQAPGVEVEVVPGVTAATAAASRLGAPLGHDFACISLSTLLTPWWVIEQRLEAAARGDFVVVFYNPLSRQRTWQLPRARDLFLKHRPAETPVGLVDKAYRPGERVWYTTLGAFEADGVGMETTVIFGNRDTRMIDGRMVTPRGFRQGERRASRAPQIGAVPATRSDPGRSILEESFAIIERDLGPHAFPPWALAVVRRMIHASADFDFASTLRYSADFAVAIQAAIRECEYIVTDTEMVRIGISRVLGRAWWISAACYLENEKTPALAAAAGLTRSAAGIRLAAQLYRAPVVVVGTAPTALDETLRLVEEGAWRPLAVIGMPVGFVGVEEAKRRLLDQARVPYLSCTGRKGGSAVAAAAVNALVEFFAPG